MNNTAIEKAVNIIGVQPLVDLLSKALSTPDKHIKFARQNIYRQVKKGYAPPDWIEIISKATRGECSEADLMADVYLNKWNCNPKDVNKQINNFLKGCSKCKQLVGKNRQPKEQGVV